MAVLVRQLVALACIGAAAAVWVVPRWALALSLAALLVSAAVVVWPG